jgi:multidrug transporter EmrE-like cation transporter
MNYWTLFVAIASQLVFSVSDVMARANMRHGGFTTENLLTPWFLIYFTIRIFATLGQLYVFASVDLGKTAALFGALSIILANVVGLLYLKESLTTPAYIGVTLALLAFCMLAFAK